MDSLRHLATIEYFGSSSQRAGARSAAHSINVIARAEPNGLGGLEAVEPNGRRFSGRERDVNAYDEARNSRRAKRREMSVLGSCFGRQTEPKSFGLVLLNGRNSMPRKPIVRNELAFDWGCWNVSKMTKASFDRWWKTETEQEKQDHEQLWHDFQRIRLGIEAKQLPRPRKGGGSLIFEPGTLAFIGKRDINGRLTKFASGADAVRHMAAASLANLAKRPRGGGHHAVPAKRSRLSQGSRSQLKRPPAWRSARTRKSQGTNTP